jgi:glycine/D-amino acid oxidase-like deaminating enzyme
MTDGRRPIPDVAIIGGGIVGAATAAFLARDGAAVTLYERSEIAAAASGRNSGVIQHPFDPILVRLYHESLSLYRELAAEPSVADGFRLAAEPSGLLLLGAGEAGAVAAAGIAANWSAAYPETRPELVSGPALRAAEPGLRDDLSACRLEIAFPVAPASATRAYAALATSRGASVRTGRAGRPVVDRAGLATGVEIDGSVEPAGAVIVAAGPWTPTVFDSNAFETAIAPIWGVVAQVELARPPRHVLEEIEIDIEPRAVPASDAGADSAAAAIGFSLVTADGETALGSTFLEAEPEPSALVEPLRARGERYLPSLATARILAFRACARPVSADRRPLVGAVPGTDRAFVAAGHGPWGISTGPATARIIADLVLGRPAGIPDELDPTRFVV